MSVKATRNIAVSISAPRRNSTASVLKLHVRCNRDTTLKYSDINILPRRNPCRSVQMHLNRSVDCRYCSNSVNALVKSVFNFKYFFFLFFIFEGFNLHSTVSLTLKQPLNVYLVLSVSLTYVKIFYLLLFIIFNFFNSF